MDENNKSFDKTSKNTVKYINKPSKDRSTDIKAEKVTAKQTEKKKGAKASYSKPVQKANNTVRINRATNVNIPKKSKYEEKTGKKAAGKEKIQEKKGIHSEKKIKALKTEKKIKKRNAQKPVSVKIPLMLLTALAVIFILLCSLLIIKPIIRNDSSYKKVTAEYVLYGKKTKKAVTRNSIFPDGKNVYINIGELYASFGLHAIGDVDDIKFYNDDGDSIVLNNMSRFALINGIQVEMDGNAYISGNDVYVPATLISRYSTGVSVEYNLSVDKLTVTTEKDDAGSSAINSVYKPFKLTLHAVEGCAPLDEDDVFS